MDRIDAMQVFIAALDEGSLAGASRRTGRSAAAVSRAVAFLEARVGVPLLHRTTRSIRLSEAGERYAAACRRVISELDEADRQAAGEKSLPRGTLAITSTVFAGVEILRPVVDAFIHQFPDVAVRLELLERAVSLVDDGMDLALRLAHLPDSSLVAHRVGAVRKVVVASPGYLQANPAIRFPCDLSRHAVVAMTHMGLDSWTFPALDGGPVPQAIPISPRLVVNSARAAIDSAVAGNGITRLLSYHVAPEIKRGALQIVLADAEPPPIPVHLVSPQGRLVVPKVRAFVDFAVPRLRDIFLQLAKDASSTPTPGTRSRRGRMSAG